LGHLALACRVQVAEQRRKVVQLALELPPGSMGRNVCRVQAQVLQLADRVKGPQPFKEHLRE